jgi:hypothetical protein
MKKPKFRPQWKAITRAIEQRMAPRCQSTYDEATSLQRRNRNNAQMRCKVADVQSAVGLAFTGPCKRARKALRKAKRGCFAFSRAFDLARRLRR